MSGTAAPPTRYPHPELPEDAYRRTTLALRAGLLASVAVSIGALAAYLLTHPGESSSTAIGSNPILQYLTLGGFAQGLAAGAPEAYLTLGIFLLIATPISRVIVGTYYFRLGRERVMAAVTLAVLVLLLLGIFVIGPLVR
jgi:uncharacterized membrane protein